MKAYFLDYFDNVFNAALVEYYVFLYVWLNQACVL